MTVCGGASDEAPELSSVRAALRRLGTRPAYISRGQQQHQRNPFTHPQWQSGLPARAVSMPEQKDPTKDNNTLDSFLGLPPSQLSLECIATSQEVRDRGSIFVAKIYAVGSVKDAHRVHAHVKHTVHGAKPASHDVAAWRCMVLKPGKSGLSGPDDFEMRTGSTDDGEQWAGGKVLKVMQEEGVIDAVVIASRW